MVSQLLEAPHLSAHASGIGLPAAKPVRVRPLDNDFLIDPTKAASYIISKRDPRREEAISGAYLHGGPLKQARDRGPHAGDALHLIVVEGGLGQPVCAPQPLLKPGRAQR